MNDILYCGNIEYVAVSIIIDGKVVKDNDSSDEVWNFRDKDEIIKLAENPNYLGTIVIQEGNKQRIYGNKDTNDSLKEILSILHKSNLIKDGTIQFIDK